MAVSTIQYKGVPFNGEIDSRCRVLWVNAEGSGNDARLHIKGGASLTKSRPILIVYSSQTGDIILASIILISQYDGEFKKIHLAGDDLITSLEVDGKDLVTNKKYWNYGQGFAIAIKQG